MNAPSRLWGLWEMLEKFAALFVNATDTLSTARWLCSPFQLKPGEAPISREQIENVCRVAIPSMRRACILSDLNDVLPELDRLVALIFPQSGPFNLGPAIPPAPLESIAQAINHFLSRIKDELNAHYFFHLDLRDVPFYLDKEPFGPSVSTKLPLAAEDIDEAGKCLALQRPTACAFHLMRVMEIGLQKFGDKLGITLIDSRGREKQWQNILDEADKAIRNMNPADAKTKQFAAISALLYNVKLAWRNETMHPKKTYTRDEALTLINGVKAFLGELASVL